MKCFALWAFDLLWNLSRLIYKLIIESEDCQVTIAATGFDEIAGYDNVPVQNVLVSAKR